MYTDAAKLRWTVRELSSSHIGCYLDTLFDAHTKAHISTYLSEVVHVSAVDVVQMNDVEIRGLARRRQRRPGTTQVLRQLARDHAL